MNIRHAIAGLAVALIFGTANVASAQDAEPAEAPSKISASIDGAFWLPLGDLADGTGVGIGAIARGSYMLQDKLHATARLGYIFALPKDQGGVDTSVSQLLILGGVRYDLGPAAIDVATGIDMIMSKASGGGVDVSETNSRIPLMIGAAVPVNVVEVGASLLIPNLLLTEDGEDMQQSILVTVGYKFM